MGGGRLSLSEGGVARFTQSALVAVSSTGDDGTYSWNWVNTRVLEGSTLTLGPPLTDLTLETAPNSGAPMKQFPGIEFTGPCAPWDFQKGTRSPDLQRL